MSDKCKLEEIIIRYPKWKTMKREETFISDRNDFYQSHEIGRIESFFVFFLFFWSLGASRDSQKYVSRRTSTVVCLLVGVDE